MELDPRTHVYLESVSPEERCMFIWTHPFLFFKKDPKNINLARKTHGATGLKHGMHTKLDSGSNMVDPTWLHLFLLVCKAKNA